MAIARCQKCGKPEGRTNKYIKSVHPIGYPDTSSICGAKGCDNSALIWLNEIETKSYEEGHNIFDLPTKAIKVKVVGY